MANPDFIAKFSRLFVQVNDENRFKRKQALEIIFKEVVSSEYITDNGLLLCSKVVHQVFDSGEKNREITCEILKEILLKEENAEKYLSIIIPEFVNKLGDKDNVEASEEIRLELMTILKLLIDKSIKSVSLFMEEILKVCCVTLTDNYGEIKRISCSILNSISVLKDHNFHVNSEQLVAPLVSNLCHQHSKVRHDNVVTLGKVLMGGSVKSFDTVCSNLAQRLFDDSTNVRRAVIEVFGEWLLELADRYSFHTRLIPVFLSGFIDDSEDIKQLTNDLWYDIGMKYLHENENDLKDEIDFEDYPPSNYPSGYERPNLGCRTLLFRTMSRILPALTRDLCDWSENTRIKAAQLLSYLIINGEGACTQHCQLLIGSTLIRGLVDEVVQVRQACRQSANLLGYFVEPKTWWNILKRIINQSEADDSFLAGEIFLLSSVIESCDSMKLIEEDVVREICDYLKSADISGSFSTKIKSAGLRCILSIVSKFNSDSSEIFDKIGYSLFYAALAFSSYESQDPSTEIKVAFEDQLTSILEKFTEALSLSSSNMLYERYTQEMLLELRSRAHVMSANSSERILCCKLLLSSGPVIGGFIEYVLEIFKITLDKEKEIDLRLKFFINLVHLTSDLDVTLNSKGLFQSCHLETLLNTAILPNLMWQAGRTAEALRKIAITCLWSLLVGCCQSANTHKANPFSQLSAGIWRDLLIRQLAILDDDLKDTRLTSCRSLIISLDIIGQYGLVDSGVVERDQLHTMYPSFVKRMDDSNDDIRILASKVLLSWIKVLREKFDVGLYQAHLNDLLTGLLVHLDDGDRQVQLATYEVLAALGRICPAIAVVEIGKVRAKHRSPRLCDDLVSEISLIDN